MTTIHADNLGRTMQCAGSRIMPADLPATAAGEQTVRDEGNAAHWLAQQVFDNHLTLDQCAAQPTRAPNGLIITSDMITHVGEYLSSLDCGAMEINTSYGGDGWFVAGRADHIKYDGTTVKVDDLKYGWRAVEPDENWTLISHAIGYCIANGITSCNVELTIYQPRPHHADGKVRTWRTNYAHLQRYYGMIQSRLSTEPSGLQSGPYCTGCHAEASCPTRRASGYNSIDAAHATIFSDDISDALLAYDLDTLSHALNVISSRKNALEELAKYRVTNGAVVGDYHLERSYGHRTWNDTLNPSLLLALTGVDLSKPGTVTPAEAERRKVPKEVIATLTTRRETGVKLVRRDIDKTAKKLLAQ